jgi:hypothetical protein
MVRCEISSTDPTLLFLLILAEVFRASDICRLKDETLDGANDGCCTRSCSVKGPAQGESAPIAVD